MKKILIHLNSDNELLCYEALSLAMTLATFDYQIQLMCDSSVFRFLIQPDNRIYGMINSLSLYDIPQIWIKDDTHSQWIMNMMDKELLSQFELSHNIDTSKFDRIINF